MTKTTEQKSHCDGKPQLSRHFNRILKFPYGQLYGYDLWETISGTMIFPPFYAMNMLELDH